MLIKTKQLFTIAIMCFMFIAFNYVNIVNATEIKDTAAGQVTWDNRADNIYEATLVTSSGTYGDAYDGAMTIILTGTVSSTMEYHFSDTYGMAIQEIAITNSGEVSTTYTIQSYGNIGSDSSTRWHYENNAGPYYTISSDKADVSTTGSDPVLSFLYGDNSVNSLGTSQSIDTSQTNYHDFEIQNVNIAAGETQRYLFLAGVGDIDDDEYNRPDKAYLAVLNLVETSNWPEDFTTFLSESEKLEIVNWDNAGSTNQEPTANFSTDETLYINEEASFNASTSSDSDGTIANYSWDWTNDGEYDDYGVLQTHTYTETGYINITLRVTDNEGATDIQTQQKYIYPEPTPPVPEASTLALTGIGSILILGLITQQRRKKD